MVSPAVRISWEGWLVVVAVLVAGVVAAGLMAGLFAGFAYAVMPGLRGVADRAFVDVMQRINVAIVNWLFLALFLGGLLVSGLGAALLWFGGGAGSGWSAAGFLLYLAMFVVTAAVNVPLNNELAAGEGADPAALRARFEVRWVRWNLVRAFAATGSFGCLLAALVVEVL
ncbi:DUF1772 domain-containing protein [Saccharopolyspora spinosa]|uniref:anthrone oxygenase family protein n=1 Tax=Saccharopolyspora spinosa TaxID=60894 RepID=UPI001ED90FE9|nr:DUF1772 domain-containing protein [Saccharopolyspora spinosa]